MLNAALAGEAGRIWLRIDDLDRARFREEYLEDIFRVVKLLGIKVTDGPSSPQDFHARWSQEHRMKNYLSALDQLRASGLLFACPCSRKELAAGRHQHGCLQGKVSLEAENVAWRINTRDLEPVLIPDLIAPEGFTVDLHAAMPDFVVRKKDGRPSYQPACVVDDVLFGINTVGRGQDLLPSTAAQAILSEMMGFGDLFQRIRFLHHPLITGEDGDKLSKSAGAEGVSGLGPAFKPEVLRATVNGWIGK
ncbi:tRNA glutamyl-Q synthetase [Neolewinella aurantiaca]|uniref:tRNA glutamyl-Q synthetase n=1 Tax=Neolewinella aurantiaca TaxID=2602767 RepID=A0A5C7FMU4_9BACT|nr:tRNA glutamyl-Q synthetase [Neolewinella aurantiaca]